MRYWTLILAMIAAACGPAVEKRSLGKADKAATADAIAEAPNDDGGDAAGGDASAGKRDDTPPAGEPEEPEAVTQDRKVTTNGAGFTLKSAKQLENTLRICVGGARTTVRGVLLLGQNGGFLNPDLYKVGENAITLSRELLDGSEAELRAGVRAAGISVPYLTALQNVANVVAYNCSEAKNEAGSAAELCECESPEKAQVMLERCLPDFEPMDLAALVQKFATRCAQDQRAAIASFVASLAFAKAQ